MDMNPSFKAAVRQALGRSVIVADRFHFSRYIYWAMDEVRRQVQKEWDKYNRTKCKRIRHVFYKRAYSFSFGYSNGFLEGINNKTKVMKRNTYGFRRFDHFRAKILLNLKYKDIGVHLG